MRAEKITLPAAIPGVNCAAVVEPRETVAPRRAVPISRIIWAVCDYVGVTVQDVASTSRTRKIVAARQMIVVLARELTPLSFPQIAEAMGRPNHSSVITMHNRWHRRVRDSAFDVSEFVDTTTGNRLPENAMREARAKIERTAA